MKPWLLYAIVRVGLLLVAVLLMWLILGSDWASLWWLGIIVAAVLAWTVSYLAFGRLRDRVAADLAARTRRFGEHDAEIEDAEIEGSAGTAPETGPRDAGGDDRA